MDTHIVTPRRWWALASVAAAQFIAVADAFIVNVAIPSIRADLHAGAAEIEVLRALLSAHKAPNAGARFAGNDALAASDREVHRGLSPCRVFEFAVCLWPTL